MKENRSLEYKAEVTNTFLKTVSAFSNFGTGKILFGVNDDGSVIGVSEPDKVCLDIENRIDDSITPKPDFALSVNGRTGVITLTVKEGKNKPYFYKGKAYRRSDTASIEVDHIELKRLVLEGSNLNYEELSADEQEYQFLCLEKELVERLGITALTTDILRTFGLITDEKEYNHAAALLADTNRFSGIDMARFGKNISEILDRETYHGISILKLYHKAIDMYKRYYQYEQINGIDRDTIELIPEKAFREAVANALVHRTWDINSHIRISMYEDRVEIASPGGLPRGLTEEEYLNGNISNLRNPILGNVFYRLHYIEMFGTGIRRIMESYVECSQKPSFQISDNSILVILPVVTTQYKVTAAGEQVLKLLQSGRLLSSSEIAGVLGWKKDKTIRVLNGLKDKEYIAVNGTGRGTKYSIR